MEVSVTASPFLLVLVLLLAVILIFFFFFYFLFPFFHTSEGLNVAYHKISFTPKAFFTLNSDNRRLQFI
jgi:hypothetical protein